MFLKLADILINVDQIIGITFDPELWARPGFSDESGRKRPVLALTTTEMCNGDYGSASRTYRYFDDEAVWLWDALQRAIPVVVTVA